MKNLVIEDLIMMIKPRKLFPFLAIFMILILGACSLPAPGAPATQDVIPEYTAAAQTIIAQLTQAAVTEAPQGEGPTTDGATATPGEVATEPAVETEPAPATETPTPTESEEPAATATESPTATSVPSDPRAALGDAEFQDTFESGDNWSLYEDDHVGFRVNDNGLRMVAFEPESWDGFMLSWPVISDVYLEMTAEPRSCSGLDRYGLVARAGRNDEGYAGYLFGVSCDGRYSLRIWDGESFSTLVDWTESGHLNAGADETNRIGIMMDGEDISLYANGNLLRELQDDTFDEGRFGVFVGSRNSEDFTVMVEEVAYWDVP